MTDRLADETAEEREARLRKMTASNHARLAAETAEESNRSCRHSSHCFNNLLSELRCLHTTWLRWTC